MRMGRPHENADKLAIELQVVGVTTVATQEASIVSARSGRDGAARSAHSSSLIGRGSSAVLETARTKGRTIAIEVDDTTSPLSIG
jgi:hypothetical protein